MIPASMQPRGVGWVIAEMWGDTGTWYATASLPCGTCTTSFPAATLDAVEARLAADAHTPSTVGPWRYRSPATRRADLTAVAQ